MLTGKTEIVIDNCKIDGYYTAVYMNNAAPNHNKLAIQNCAITNCDWAYSIDHITPGSQDIPGENLVFTGNMGVVEREVFPNANARVIDADGITQSVHSTIQAAIDAADAGDTILVAPGTYKEQLVVDKALSILGRNASIAGTGTRNDEVIITYPDDLKDDYLELVYIGADDVTFSGFSLDDGDYEVDTNGITVHGDNVQITNNILDGFSYVQILATSYIWNETANKWETKFIDDILIEGNYAKNALNYTAIYMQGASGSVQNNQIENAPRAIQIQPYGNSNGGTVKNNTVSAYTTGIWYNYARKGAGPWEIKQNTISAVAIPSGFTPVVSTWAGLEVQTFGTEGTGVAPSVTFTGNFVDGSGASTTAGWTAVYGLSMTPNIHNDATATFTDNTFTNVEVGAYKGAGTLDLDAVRGTNTFDEGSIVVGDQILIPEA